MRRNMARDLWRGLSASWRLGGALRLQKQGHLNAAKRAFTLLDQWCDRRQATTSPSYAGVRMMVLVHLAEIELELGDKEFARASLEKWLREYERVVGLQSLGPTVELSKWENWVRETLAQMGTSHPQAHTDRT